jgi:hypothetical protein
MDCRASASATGAAGARGPAGSAAGGVTAGGVSAPRAALPQAEARRWRGVAGGGALGAATGGFVVADEPPHAATPSASRTATKSR